MQEPKLTLVRNSMPERESAIVNFLTQAGWGNATRGKLAGDASFRHYDWLEKGGNHAVLMDAPPEKESILPFLKIGDYLVKRGFSAPKILAKDSSQGFLLLEDLGRDSFTSFLKEHPTQESKLYFAAADVLVELHQSAEIEIDLQEYNQEKLLEEAALFVDWYLPALIGEAKGASLREAYLDLWREILSCLPFFPPVVVLRDYHADNLMWLPEREGKAQVGLLDFQDALLGSPAYDLVSLLEDARRDIPPEIVQITFNRYVQKMAWDKSDFSVCYAALGAQRNAKIIGIFTRLALRDNKPHYLQLIPRVWGNLQRDLTHSALKPIKEWMDKTLPENQRIIPLLGEKKLAG